MSRVDEALRRREQEDAGERESVERAGGPAQPIDAGRRDSGQPIPLPAERPVPRVESVESMIHRFVVDFQQFVKEWNGD